MKSQAGLCDSCIHCQLVTTRRGSTFILCRRSEDDPHYTKYPRLPVERCEGFEAGQPERRPDHP